jgi:Protein of unknown function (DUF3551)
MTKLTAAGLALFALLTTAQASHAYVNYPWCIVGDSRGVECYFSSREQCAQDGRNRGFGGQCIRNPWYDPALGPVVEAKNPNQLRKPYRRHNDF